MVNGILVGVFCVLRWGDKVAAVGGVFTTAPRLLAIKKMNKLKVSHV